MVPVGVIRPMVSEPAVLSPNQTLPSGPAVTDPAQHPAGIGKSVSTPVGVILPMLPRVANHRLPSEPVAIPFGLPWERPNWVTTPAGVIRPMAPGLLTPGGGDSVNQTLPSGPAVIDTGWRFVDTG